MNKTNEYEILVISIASPILIGVYENSILIKTIENNGKTSDILPIIIEELLNTYKLTTFFYVNGPGSYMAIKVAYIFLKTISITNSITFQSCSGFALNNNSPIKALGKKYFFNNKQTNEISINFLEEDRIIKDFVLPSELSYNIFSNETLPNYQLPSVT